MPHDACNQTEDQRDETKTDLREAAETTARRLSWWRGRLSYLCHVPAHVHRCIRGRVEGGAMMTRCYTPLTEHRRSAHLRRRPRPGRPPAARGKKWSKRICTTRNNCHHAIHRFTGSLIGRIGRRCNPPCPAQEVRRLPRQTQRLLYAQNAQAGLFPVAPGWLSARLPVSPFLIAPQQPRNCAPAILGPRRRPASSCSR